MPYRVPLHPYVIFQADPPDLPARQKGDPGGPEFVVKAALVSHDVRGAIFAGVTNTGRSCRFEIQLAAPGIVRVWLHGDHASPVKLARDLSTHAVELSIQETPSAVKLETPEVTVQVNLEPFKLTFFGPDGRLMLEQNPTDTDVTDRMITLPFGFSELDGQRVAFHDSFTAEPDEHFFGFGEKFTDFDKRGQRIEMWHYDAYGAHSERAYKNVPFYVSTRGYGLFVDSTSPIRFDMASSNHSVVSVIVPDVDLDYYFIAGPSLKTVISRYCELVSFPILPAKWAFGLWMSSGFKRDSADEVFARARELREHDIPADVLHLDCYWQRFGRWSDLQWDLDMFPDPAGLIRRVHEAGFKVCLWINSYIGIESPLLEELKQKGYLLKTTDGNPWIGDLWGGAGQFHPEVGILDVTHPQAVEWFKSHLRTLLKLGADVFKTDFGEGVPAQTVAHNGMTGLQLHNLYPLLYNDVVAEVTREVTGGTGLVWGRSTYAGGQRHAAQWGGDPNCTYQGMASTLRGGLSMGMCGHAFWSHDIGGFHRLPSPELYVRWAQFGFFSPLSRAHGMTTRLPWDFGDEAERIFREYARLRYRLLPYIYSYAVVAHETGLPIMRAMTLEFQDDPVNANVDLQYMFGSEILVAPVYNSEGVRPVYFPSGRWVDFWTNEIIAGPQTRTVRVPLDVLPLYVRANALIPTITPTSPIADAPFEPITFDCYLMDHGSFDLHDVDGLTRVGATLSGGALDVQAEGAKSRFELRLLPLPGTAVLHTVRVNGELQTYGQAWSRRANGAVHIAVQT